MSTPTYTATVTGYTLSDVDQWFELIDQLCSFAYICGRSAALVAAPREIPFFIEPQHTLAWEAGYDEAPRN